jgi:HK97 gp10 family phage protein
MRAGGGVEIKGLDELRRKLKDMGQALAGQVMTDILKAAADPVLNDAIAKCPTDTGTLRSSIKLNISPPAKTGAKVAVVAGEGFFLGETFYGGFVEYGHFTGKRKGRKGVDADKYRNKQIAAGRKWVAAKPFMRPAADENKDRVLNIIQQEVTAAIEGAVT